MSRVTESSATSFGMQPSSACSSSTWLISTALDSNRTLFPTRLMPCVLYIAPIGKQILTELSLYFSRNLETRPLLSDGFSTSSTKPLSRSTRHSRQGTSTMLLRPFTDSGCTNSVTCSSCVNGASAPRKGHRLTIAFTMSTGGYQALHNR